MAGKDLAPGQTPWLSPPHHHHGGKEVSPCCRGTPWVAVCRQRGERRSIQPRTQQNHPPTAPSSANPLPPKKKSSFAGGLVGLRALGVHLVDISRSSRAGSVWLLRGRLGALCAVPTLLGRSGKVRRDGMGEKSGCCPDTPPPRGCCQGGYENAAELHKKAGGCGGIGASTCRPAQPAPAGQERQDPSPFTTSEPPHPPPCTRDPDRRSRLRLGMLNGDAGSGASH